MLRAAALILAAAWLAVALAVPAAALERYRRTTDNPQNWAAGLVAAIADGKPLTRMLEIGRENEDIVRKLDVEIGRVGQHRKPYKTELLREVPLGTSFLRLIYALHYDDKAYLLLRVEFRSLDKGWVLNRLDLSESVDRFIGP